MTRYLALGDSYTIGEAVAPHERWPNRLAMVLAMDEPQIIARTGWTTDELNAALDAAAPDGRFDLVSLLIGVNNQYRGRSVVQYRREFAALLQRAIGFAGGDPHHVLVLSIPDWGATPFAEGRDRAQIAREIDAFNDVNREETLKARARYVDITPITREHRDLVSSDGLHPSGEMYKKWVEAIVGRVRSP